KICLSYVFSFFFQAEDGIRDFHVTGVQTCALPISEGLVPAARCDIPGELRVCLSARCNAAAERGYGRDPRYDARHDGDHAQRGRSEERRVGNEWRCRWWPEQEKKTARWTQA